MKRFIFPVFLMFSIVCGAQSVLITDTSNVWWARWHGMPGEPTPVTKYFFSGDTVINMHRYNKLYSNPYNTTVFFEGVMRTDSQGVVLFIGSETRIGTIGEVELYNFHHKQGDTIRTIIRKYSVLNPFDTILTIILRVDTVNQYGAVRKRLFVQGRHILGNPLGSDYWLEGVGSASDLLDPLKYIGFESYSVTECFSTHWVSRGSDGLSCLSGFEVLAAIQDVVIYPNPTAGMLSFSGLQCAGNCLIQIFNIEGLKMIERKVNTLEAESFQIDGLGNGVYICKIIEQGRTSYRKFMVGR